MLRNKPFSLRRFACWDYSLVSTILKVMAQLQMLFSEWLDQDLVNWIQVNLLSQYLAWFLVLGANHSLLFFVQYRHHHIETRQIRTILVP